MKQFFIFLLTLSFVKAQDTRYYIEVNDPDHAQLIGIVTGVPGNITIVRDLDYPNQGLNALAATMDSITFTLLRIDLANTYGPNFILTPDPISGPTEGSGDDPLNPIAPTPFPVNLALDQLVPARPILSPPTGPLTGKIIVDVVGTGIDQAHPDFSGVTFETPLSVMFDGSGGYLPADIDYHNHESRLAGCISGEDHGILSALGTMSSANLRSVLCYDKPLGSPSLATTFTSDCIAAISEIAFEHELRVNQPYLKNHAAIICYAHSVQPGVSGANVRVGSMDAAMDHAWSRGIFTAISAGNRPIASAASSPAGAGEWIAYEDGTGSIVTKRYWPTFGALTFDLPGAVGFTDSDLGFDFHLKAGAHDAMPTPGLWTVHGTLGSSFNDSNPAGFGPPMNNGVDLFAPGQEVPVPATRIVTPPLSGLPTRKIDGVTYSIERGYQEGNGTSYSAAFTAGLAARIFQLRPWASNAQVRQAILDARSTSGLEVMNVPDLTTLDPMAMTYTEWIARYENIAPFGYFFGGLDEEMGDPDGDGVPNLVEYHCGMDPRHKDAQHAPKVIFDEDSLTVTVKMQLAAYLPDPKVVDWQIESSSNLSTWTNEGKGDVSTFPETAANGDGTNIEGELTFTTSAMKEFYRVAIYSLP